MVEIKRKFDKKHPLKIALEYYLDKEISYDNFTSIMPKVEHQMNFFRRRFEICCRNI